MFSYGRKYGKSLLLSTLKNIFEGNKELFDGLYIYVGGKCVKIMANILSPYLKKNQEG
jgi:hypothetical protein